MWTHYCEEEQTILDVEDGKPCNWCNEYDETTTSDTDTRHTLQPSGDDLSSCPIMGFGNRHGERVAASGESAG